MMIMQTAKEKDRNSASSGSGLDWLVAFKRCVDALTSVNDPGRLLTSAYGFIRDMMPSEAFYYGAVEHDQVNWQFIFENESRRSEIAEPLDEIIARTISGKESAIASQDDGRFKTTMGAPVVIHDEVTGLLVCRSESSNAYSNQDMQLLSLLGFYFGLTLENTKLQKLEKAIEEREHLRSVVKLAGSVGHELNQPLTGIAGYCALIKEELADDNPIYHDVLEIEKQAARLEKLVVKFQTIVDLEKSRHAEMTDTNE